MRRFFIIFSCIFSVLFLFFSFSLVFANDLGLQSRVDSRKDENFFTSTELKDEKKGYYGLSETLSFETEDNNKKKLLGNIIKTSSTYQIILGNFLGIFLSFVGTIFFFLLIYAGFLWMTSQGNEQQTQKSLQVLGMAVVGIIAIFAAQAILTYFLNIFG